MTKRKSPGVNPRISLDGRSGKPRAEAPPADAIARHLPSPAAIRETIESIVIAFVLAFLFRTFEAEAFVIPTGSMAPTLMGRHKDLCCPKCGCPYQLSASDEVDSEGALNGPQCQTVAGTCPMCRYTAPLEPNNPQNVSYPSYNGDRILVGKFLYELDDPQRWDVIVFKFPGDPPTVSAAYRTDARTNFIKRLVGLPGETVRIQNGDLWLRRGKEPFQIARKPPKKLLAMLQPVFDNDYMPRIAECGWPARWRPEPSADGRSGGAWNSDDYATFHIDGTAAGESWLRYHHLVPTYSQWRVAQRESKVSPPNPISQLITDFTAYDTAQQRRSENSAPEADGLGQHWVGDLALQCTADVASQQGQLLLELRKGGRRFQCRIDVATGQATLSISGRDMEQFRPAAATSVRGPGRHELLFSNCDNELRLWVDGNVVQFDGATTYPDLANTRPDQADLAPVGVASVGARVGISHLRVLRDIYYGAVRGEGMPRENCDVCYATDHALPDEPLVPHESRRYVEFSLGPDQFFVLGDNSAKSKDSRLWGHDNYWVPRELLIGKALFIYWPHSWNKIPYVSVPFPFFPNFGRMGLVR
jgi:signal peptidase I